MSELRTETVDCPCCGDEASTDWARENGFVAVKCDECGAVYVRDRPSAETISAAARDGVHQTDQGVLDQRLGWQGWKVPLYSRIVRRFFDEERPASWLDVGAGNGEFVRAVQRALPDTEVTGIEPMAVKVEAARKRGIPVREETLETVGGRYDCVSLINVFSHIPDFLAFGEQIKAHLNPGGYLFLETGNGGDLASRADYPGDLLLPDHLIFVGIGQMERLLTRLGFGRIEHITRRIDHPWWAAKQMAKGALRGRPKIVLPYTRPFRTVIYRAQLAA